MNEYVYIQPSEKIQNIINQVDKVPYENGLRRDGSGIHDEKGGFLFPEKMKRYTFNVKIVMRILCRDEGKPWQKPEYRTITFTDLRYKYLLPFSPDKEPETLVEYQLLNKVLIGWYDFGRFIHKMEQGFFNPNTFFIRPNPDWDYDWTADCCPIKLVPDSVIYLDDYEIEVINAEPLVNYNTEKLKEILTLPELLSMVEYYSQGENKCAFLSYAKHFGIEVPKGDEVNG